MSAEGRRDNRGESVLTRQRLHLTLQGGAEGSTAASRGEARRFATAYPAGTSAGAADDTAVDPPARRHRSPGGDVAGRTDAQLVSEPATSNTQPSHSAPAGAMRR